MYKCKSFIIKAILLIVVSVQTSGYIISPEVQVVFAGDTAFIKCTLPQAKWKKKEDEMPPQVSITENGISLFALTVKDTGNYTCYQKKMKFTVESLSAIVIVGVKDITKAKPRLIKQHLYASSSFQCKSDKEVSWFYHKKIIQFKNVARDYNNNLHIASSRMENGGEYYCYGYDRKNKVYFLSRVFFVVIVPNKLIPSNVVLRKGQDVSFQCITAYPEDTKFFFNNGKLPDNVKKIGNELYIRNADSTNKGTYECLGKLNNRPYFSLISAVATIKFRSIKLNGANFMIPIFDVEKKYKSLFSRKKIPSYNESLVISKWKHLFGREPVLALDIVEADNLRPTKLMVDGLRSGSEISRNAHRSPLESTVDPDSYGNSIISSLPLTALAIIITIMLLF